MNRLVAIVGPTATGKSALAIAVARRCGGEVVACDSTAVYRGLDIGTDKVPPAEQGGVPHHLMDIADITSIYSAAEYAREAAATIRVISARGHMPILVGGSGFYYRALVRGLFAGPSRSDDVRRRLERIAARKGVEWLWRWLGRVDASSAARVMPRDQKRIVRALEVYLLTGRPLSDHFAETRSPIADYGVFTIGLRMERSALLPRITQRVDAQIEAGVVDEVARLREVGVPLTTHAFSGLVYRQVVEHLRGERDLAATRELIVRENLRYARRQRLWFEKEPGVRWVEGPGEGETAQRAVFEAIETWRDAGPENHDVTGLHAGVGDH